MSSKYNYHITHFVYSAPCISNLFYDRGIEIAFAGSSNVGKSSAINILTNQKNLARTGKKPGSTKLINFFEVEPGIRLVDLPGYGYAKVPVALKSQWQYGINEYLQKRESLKGLVVLIDIRHTIKYLDKCIIQFAVELNLPVFILLNKADKITACARQAQLNNVRKNIPSIQGKGDVEVEIFSSWQMLGVNKLKQKLDSWFSSGRKINSLI
ncbi:YihA family ribosome biogenesis GTP-binding protein [Candidatus Palibaumannia cicadellinicola]|uniref:Probable GTP-binding protein EngB n=1 Tax=Candidatus Palibaumannia cicadellinicola TaxID=186490 RepID=A0A2N4XWL6_9GAMM|nr:ribosome biogenesis GTP-binding protein YihA/YsxC [Candidatus Baumannia cicadellinicola]PLK58472.1 YihA family ribosome biogenesis GTP-binding protein [Candidatus Baumannia cicadellinicola]